MIDFSTLKELYVDGKKVTSLFLDGHEVPFGDEAPKYLTVTALERTATVSIDKIGSPPDFSLEYSTDGDMWSSYRASQTITLAAGKSVMFRRVGDATTTFSSSVSNYWHFIASAPLKVSGNIMSLLDASMQSTTVGSNCFRKLFEKTSNVVDASELQLPATTLSTSCYANMFRDCISLTAAPALPATTLANYCYIDMFNNCSSLIAAPALPATTLADQCYSGMFRDCISLTAAPAVLPAMTLADSCYGGMFNNCSSLTAAPALPATTLADNCYSGMFQGCTSLSTAPALPAITLATRCYFCMFQNCTSLSTAPAALPATTLAYQCYSGMFQGCTSLSSAPALPATTLAITSSCYSSMFINCSSLSFIKTNQASFNGCTDWVKGVASSGTFICPSALGTDATIRRGANYCPTGWTVVNSDA